MIELDNVTRIFNQGRPDEVVAVRDVSLSLPAGKVSVIKGPSGSGKTTLLTMIACLARPTRGRVRLDGETISALPEHFMAQMRRHTFGFIFQRFNLVRGLSVLENVMLPAYPEGENYRSLRRRAEELLQRLQLAHRASARVEELSGGEAQRVAIARALVNDPGWIIADEPTANLDSRLVRRFLDEMAALKAAGKSLVITSHDERVYTDPMVDVVVEMEDGQVVSVMRR